MATVTPGKIFTANEIVTPPNLNALGVPTVTLADSEVTTAKIADGAVTQEKLNSSVTLVPTGAVMPFARATAPSGWLIANGDTVPNATGTVQGVTTDFTALYAAVGNSFGSLGKLPDLGGIFVRGSGTQVIGSTTYSKAFALKETDSVGPHTHSGLVGNHQHNIIANATGTAAPYTSVNIDANDYLAARAETQSTSDWSYTLRGVSTAATLGLTSSNGAQTITTSSQSPASTTETRPANIALLYCIKI